MESLMHLKKTMHLIWKGARTVSIISIFRRGSQQWWNRSTERFTKTECESANGITKMTFRSDSMIQSPHLSSDSWLSAYEPDELRALLAISRLWNKRKMIQKYNLMVTITKFVLIMIEEQVYSRVKKEPSVQFRNTLYYLVTQSDA